MSLTARTACLTLVFFCLGALSLHGQEVVKFQSVPDLDSPMLDDPPIELPEVRRRIAPGTKPLWIKALQHTEGDLRQQACFAIGWAHGKGEREWDELIPHVLSVLQEDDRRFVRLAAAQALVAIDARQAAATLHERAVQDGFDMAQIVEPALARWGYQPMLKTWRKRLTQPNADPRRTLLAIQGVEAMEDEQSVDDLLRIATSGRFRSDLRLASAQAVGQICSEGLVSHAAPLIERTIVDRLAAARLLQEHSSDEAKEQMLTLAKDELSSVAVIVLKRLRQIDPDAVLPLADTLLARGDVNVRRVVAKSLADRPLDRSLEALGDLLADANPSLRKFVGDSLIRLGESPDLRSKVISQGKRMIDHEHWGAVEQSIRLLTKLNHTSQSDKFLDLLQHERPEVFATSAWGLRVLGLDETLDRALAIAEQRNENRLKLMVDAATSYGVDEQLSQLNQFFAAKRYLKADAYLRTFVPKTYELRVSRAAAIWALGYFYEGKPDKELAQQLSRRATDVEPPQPELTIVRRFAAISLGRMNAREELDVLKIVYGIGGADSEPGYAAGWAIEQITGDPFEKAKPRTSYFTTTFLEPLPEK